MVGRSVPIELLVLALVGLAGFGLGWWLRRRGRVVPEIEAQEVDGGPTAIVSQFVSLAEIASAEPVSKETVATLAAASQAIYEIHLHPTCPICHGRMEKRVFNEKKILVCEEFPGCRGARMADE